MTVTLLNDTDKYVIYEFTPNGIQWDGTYLTLTPSVIFASPLVDSGEEIPTNSGVCIDFDLFRGEKTYSQSGVNSTLPSFFLVPVADYDGMVVEYVVRKTDSGTTGTRTGTIMAAWDGTTVQYTDQSTRDAGNSTAGLQFKIDINSGNARVGLTRTSGTYEVSINVRPYGFFS